MAALFDKTLNEIKNNRIKGSAWIPLPYPKLSKYVGITRKQYVLLGGDPGTGKTAFAYRSYIIGPYEYLRRNPNSKIKFKAVIWAFERSKERTMAKLICLALWHEKKVLVDVPTILSWGEGVSQVSEKLLADIEDCREYIEGLESMVEIRDGLLNPTGMYKEIEKIALANGHYKEITHTSGYIEKVYVPDDEDTIFFFLVDHAGLAKKERGFQDKENLDKMSEYLRIGRDRFGFSCCVICQFNRSTNDTARRKSGFELIPEKSDFKGSGNLFEDADLVQAIFNPAQYGLKQHLGYDISMFKSGVFNRFRSSHILKNTYGPDGLHLGHQFIGECGGFSEVPLPNEMTPTLYRSFANLSSHVPGLIEALPPKTIGHMMFDALE